MVKLYIVRHAKTDQNDLGLAQGTKDIEINEEGIKQALELSKTINAYLKNKELYFDEEN